MSSDEPSLSSIGIGLARLETKLDAIIANESANAARHDQHELRLGDLEKKVAWLKGVGSSIAGVVTILSLISSYKWLFHS